MRPEYRFFILVGSLLFQLGSFTAGADFSVSEVLHSAYLTRLFALETRLANLDSRNQLTTEEQISLTQLKMERERLCRRIKVSKHYVRTRPAKMRNRMSRKSIDPIVTATAERYGINPNFVHAMITCESDYDVQALSRTGAMGLMQLMPETAADLGVQNPWSPEENIDGGVRYILAMLKEFRDPWKALVSYNCGPEVLRQGLPIPAESRGYASKVLRVFNERRYAAGS